MSATRDNRRAVKQQPSATIFNTCSISGVAEHIEEASIDLAIHDPPFGINGDRVSYRVKQCKEKGFVVPGYREIPKGQYPDFAMGFMEQTFHVLREGGTACVFSGGQNLHHIMNAADKLGFHYVTKVIWQYPGMYCKGRFIDSHYDILIFIKPPLSEKTFNTFARFNNTKASYFDRENVWQEIERKQRRHGEKRNMNSLPVDLPGKLIDYCSNPGDTVLDMFGGEFTVGHAALKKGRNYVGFEINKHAVDEFAESLPTDDLTIYQ